MLLITVITVVFKLQLISEKQLFSYRLSSTLSPPMNFHFPDAYIYDFYRQIPA